VSEAPVTRISSGGPYEDLIGYSRAVVVPGDRARVLVSGTTSVLDGAVQGVGDAHRQAQIALDTIEQALVRAGSGLDHVIRSRMYVVGREHCDGVGRAHAQRLRRARPASSMIVISGMVDPLMLVEIEVEAVLP
jgi:enamine deaminase RidA (YjgF/YER057c/UK114 family)